MKVLIAEDDAISRKILHRAVQQSGHECLAAADGEEAWQLYCSTPDVEVIISDWMMPGMDGSEFCRRVRSLDREVYPFFVFLTALKDRTHLLEGMEAGADDYLAKPLDREELRVRLAAAARVTSLHRKMIEQHKELELLNKELHTLARRDTLTRLGNRLQLREDLEVLHARVERYGYSYCAILCDVDSFKLYNDHYGHLAGDEVLQRVANATMANFRTGDSSYRYGGEEFLTILPEQPLEKAILAADRLRESIEDLSIPHEGAYPENGSPGVVTVSIGVSGLVAGESKSVEHLLKEADEALYRAKEAGKNQVAVYERLTRR